MSNSTADIDIESYRHSHESSSEWNLRKPFLLTHWDKFDESRLVCLSCCFINVEIYGCSYPPAVMTQLRELADDIRDTIDSFQSKHDTSIKFVKAAA